MWDYAEHSHTVKIHGGPKKYDQYIKNQAGIKYLIVIASLIPFAVKGAADIAKDLKKK